MPSIADLLFLLLLMSLSIGILAPRLLGDAGTGWHIVNGQLILRDHTITRTDPFSATMKGQPWYAWEWLFDLAIARIHQWAGLNGVVFFAATVIAVTFAVAFRLALRRGASVPVALILLVLAIASSAIHLFARPHILSWLLAVVWFEWLDASETNLALGRDHRLFWLPVLTLFWVNVHGGFVLGFALCGIYLCSGMMRYWRTRESGEKVLLRGWLGRLAAVSGISFLTGLINPFGYKLYLHVFQYLSDRFLMNHIDEFRSPDFHGVAQQCFAALLLVAMVSVATGRRMRLSRLLVLLFAAYSGLYASRNLPVSSLLIMLVIAPQCSETLARAADNSMIATWLRRFLTWQRGFAQRVGELENRMRGHLWALVAVLIGTVVCAQQGQLGSYQIMRAHFDAKRFPVGAVDELERRGIREPVFSEDYWGGYLIYRLYPQNRVFVDDRHDFYGDAFLKRYLKIIHVEPGWEQALKEVNPTCVLLQRESTLTNILKEVPQWTVVYEDQTATLFMKSSP